MELVDNKYSGIIVSVTWLFLGLGVNRDGNSAYLVQNQTSLSNMNPTKGLIANPVRIYLIAALARISTLPLANNLN